MKASEFRKLIKEEVRKTLKEGVISKSVKPRLQGEVKVAVEALETRLIDLITLAGVTRNAKELAKDISNIIKAVKQDETGAEDDPF